MSKQVKNFFNRRFFVLNFLLFFLVVVVFGFSFGYFNLRPVSSGDSQEKMFVVSPGENLQSVANRLEQANLIRNSWVFMLLVYQQGLNQKIQAGDFRLSSSMNAREIAQSLTFGSLDVWVTIIPGTRAEEVALVLKDKLAAFDSEWFENLKKNEGYLMPDSYLIPRNASWDNFWQIVNKNYQAKVTPEILTGAQSRGLSEKQLIILASLIEREAKNFVDQQAVAGVLLNRISDRWPLQVDASVQYVLANQRCPVNVPSSCTWWPKATPEDLRTAVSDYNTYQTNSFPPGPICNPSPGAIRAVANAPQDSPFWYYISDSSGTLHLAKTLAEHEENINRYLR
ncbi:MAG: endolytic transglycosylase MltG [Candidatus Shapirobacteria bacterium]|nr:endolytic transglycosylase MltG [Candidatus Shapirobacteria bacterium]